VIDNPQFRLVTSMDAESTQIGHMFHVKHRGTVQEQSAPISAPPSFRGALKVPGSDKALEGLLP
jgi:hypothetical protein